MYRSRVAGTGSYLPERRLTNADLEKMVDTSDSWITDRTGIRARHIAAEGQYTTDLAYQAATRALEMSGLKPTDLDLIIFATVTPDQVMPSSSCILQQKLGCGSIPSFDLSAACTGFVYSLTVANQFIQTGMYKNVLVIGAEILSRIMNYKDRETCILFGDGAGAFIVSRAEEGTDSQFLSSHLYAEGQFGDLITLPGGGSRNPLSQRVLDEGLHFMTMKGREIFKHAVRTLIRCSEEALTKHGLTVEDVDWVVAHQANIRILEAVQKGLRVAKEKVIINIEDMGNTSAATIPFAFDNAVRAGKIKRGQLCLLAAFGAGITSGSLLLRY
ncbi:MAG: beta-ketoacyl-ACP synthase III [Bdellovibrionia bacterium]